MITNDIFLQMVEIECGKTMPLQNSEDEESIPQRHNSPASNFAACVTVALFEFDKELLEKQTSVD
jgi:hypothetical protein